MDISDQVLAALGEDKLQSALMVMKARVKMTEGAMEGLRKAQLRHTAFLTLASAILTVKAALFESWGVFSDRFIGVCGEEMLKSLALRRRTSSRDVFDRTWDKLILIANEHQISIPDKVDYDE